ncbi:hypothetical protein [Paenibacillus camerounensis]|uniref:hypothetical protein n=1 Tax=Paenibacillus camerounensis TaxID=1243663 RepID=UPI0005AB4945|nr:hypothetical protein [Paenibacillus camerounensis]
MPKHALDSNYFLNKAGVPDPFVQNLNDCYERALYFIMSNRIENISKYQKIFIGDLSFCLKIDPSYRNMRLTPNKNDFAEALVLERHFHLVNDANESMLQIENLLNDNFYLMLRTAENKLPFLKRFDPDYVIDESYNPGHFLLIIWHDKENLYYVENPQNLSLERHITLASNSEVGIIKKSDILIPFNYFVECFSVKINQEHLETAKVAPINVFSRYDEQDSREDYIEGSNYYYNQRALQKLISMCNEERLFLNLDYSRPDENKLLVGLDRIIRRRKMLYDYMAGGGIEKKGLPLLKKSIEEFELTRYALLNNILRGNWLLDKSYASNFENILQVELELFNTKELRNCSGNTKVQM